MGEAKRRGAYEERKAIPKGSLRGGRRYYRAATQRVAVFSKKYGWSFYGGLGWRGAAR